MAHVLLVDMAIHQFDAVRFLLDQDPVSVYCEEFNPAWSWYNGNAAATAVFQMSGGTRYTYTGSWCADGLETSWNGAWRVNGAGGTALWDGAGEPLVEALSGPVALAPASHPEEISGALMEFVGALRTGTVPVRGSALQRAQPRHGGSCRAVRRAAGEGAHQRRAGPCLCRGAGRGAAARCPGRPGVLGHTARPDRRAAARAARRQPRRLTMNTPAPPKSPPPASGGGLVCAGITGTQTTLAVTAPPLTVTSNCVLVPSGDGTAIRRDPSAALNALNAMSVAQS